MSLKITHNGFTIGGVLNPSITVIYVRVLADMTKQDPITDADGNVTHVEIKAQAKTTLQGGLFDDSLQVDYISNIYRLKYDSEVTDMNEQYLELEEDLKEKLIQSNPDWEGNIEIVNIGV